MSSIDSNPLSNKISKILSQQLDNDTLDALKSVSNLIKDNNLSNRRNLRTNIEKQSLKINEEFVESFRSVNQYLNDLYKNVNQMNENCRQMQKQIEVTRSQTSHLLNQTNQLSDQLKRIEVKELVANRFIDVFQLKPEEIMIINNTNEDIDDKFFEVLEKVREIHEKSKILLTNNVEHTTGIEIMDSMSLNEETANERLYRWTLNILRTISSDIIEVHPQLFRAMACLQEREILFNYCLDEYITVRRSAIVRNFIEALTRGRNNGNSSAIELHSNDVIRYIGDMLAVLHQSIANEKEMIDTLLKLCDKEKLKTTNLALISISSITEGLCRPLKVRIEQSLISENTSATKSGPSVYYRIKNIISFYLHTLTQTHLLIAESPFIYTLKELHILSDKIFYNSLNYSVARIGKSQTSDIEVPNNDLKPTDSVTQIVSVLKEVLSCQKSCLSSDEDRELEVQQILSTVIEPLIQSCIISASKLTAIEMTVFLFNCLFTINQTLSEYQFTERFKDIIIVQMESHIETLVNEQISHIISYLGLSSLQNAILQKDDLVMPLSQLSGCDPLAIRSAMLKMDTFIAEPTNLAISQSSYLIDSKTKDIIWKRSLESICLVYEQLYEAVNNKVNNYVDPNSLMTYKPEQIKMLLL